MGMNLVSVRSDKAACLAAFANPDSPEVFEKLSPRSNVPLPAPYDTDEVVLRLTATQEGTPLPELADERQTIVEQPSPGEVLLRIERVVPEQKFTLPITPASPLEQECLEPSLQIE
jgi:hypothetical protein